MRRTAAGAVVAVAGLAACTAVLVAIRSQLDPATPPLVLVIPVLAGVAIGGFWSGLVAAAFGFLACDWFFLKPYGTLSVSHDQDWASLVVYLVVVLVSARLVEVERRSRELARAREALTRQLLEVSDRLIAEEALEDVLTVVTETVRQVLGARFAAVLLPAEDGRLELAAVAGDLDEAARAALTASDGGPQSLALAGGRTGLRRVALLATHGPVGQLVLDGPAMGEFERRVLGVVSGQAALAIERRRLREQAVRAELLEQADGWRNALLGAVSHDLRTPLASIVAAVTTLRTPGTPLRPEDHDELLATVEAEAASLTRLVENLLDMARIEAGSLVPRLVPQSVHELLERGIAVARAATAAHRVVLEVPDELPLVEADEVLVGQVLANLLTNAAQHAPEGSTITVRARVAGPEVAITVRDEGPGVAEADRERIFHLLDRAAGAGRAGLGLAISRAFVEAQGGRLVLEDGPGGASFTFGLPVSALEEAAGTGAARTTGAVTT